MVNLYIPTWNAHVAANIFTHSHAIKFNVLSKCSHDAKFTNEFYDEYSIVYVVFNYTWLAP